MEKTVETNSNIALIALDDNDRIYYQQLLSSFNDTSISTHVTIHHFKTNCIEKLYSGIIMDNRTLITSSLEDKVFYSQLCNGFPVIRISKGLTNDDFSCILEGSDLIDLKGNGLLEHFIQVECKKIVPHHVRTAPRKKIFLNTYLYINQDRTPIKTNLWDISEGGCFIITADDWLRKGDRIEMTINELNDKTPIHGEIRWKRCWGAETNKLPGVGIHFTKIKENQLEQILTA